MTDIINCLRHPVWIHSHVSVSATATLDEDQAIADMKNAADEIEALARFLQIAIDIHEENFGRANEERYPKDWTVQARKRLAALNIQQRASE